MSQQGTPPSSVVADSLTSVPPPAPIQVGGNGQAGGYKFEPDQVQGVIAKWKTLLDDLVKDANDARTVAQVSAPGSEFASGDFMKAATPSGKTLLEQHNRMIEYVKNYIDALTRASGKIQQGESDAQQAAAKMGKGIV